MNIRESKKIHFLKLPESQKKFDIKSQKLPEYQNLQPKVSDPI